MTPLDDEDDAGRVSWREPLDAKSMYKPPPFWRKKSMLAVSAAFTALAFFAISSDGGSPDRSDEESSALESETEVLAIQEEQDEEQDVATEPSVPTPSLPPESLPPESVPSEPLPSEEEAGTSGTEPLADPTTTGDDIDLITRELFGYKAALERQPDPSRASVIYVDGSPAFRHFVDDLETWAATGTTSGRPQPEVVNVSTERNSTNRVTVQATTTYGDGPALVEKLVLIRTETDGRWRIADHLVNEA